MSDAIAVSAPVSGTDRELSFETGKLAGQADGAVSVRLGDTVVLVTATASRKVREGTDFFPLTVDMEERMYAAGKIPGSFFRREGRATDQAILTCRLIDRPLRPSFPKGFRNEVHVVGLVLAADQENPHDVLAINAASAALMLSGMPFEGPIGAVRVAYTTEGKWIPHPSYQDGDASTFEMVVAGREVGDGDVAIMMVEAGGTERAFEYYMDGAPKVTEAVVVDGLEAAKHWIREAIDLQCKLVDKAGVRPALEYELYSGYDDEVIGLVRETVGAELASALSIPAKQERNQAVEAAEQRALDVLSEKLPERDGEVRAALKALTKEIVRQRIVTDGVRIDGRGPQEIRQLSAEVGFLPTAHGSALFERGETQVLNVTTLGMPRLNQLLDTIGTDEFKRYMHHYNFPPFSTGEVGFMRGPKRREIGHGLLAERALLPVVPPVEEFPYTLRLVSDVLSSNGSTSMASVCGSTLSLMDAGVPIKAPVAGIAMGLVYEEGKYVTLTDILGAEDAFGDMDFKVAGTSDVITALQLDTKIDGLPAETLAAALTQAKEARLRILEVMHAAIPEARATVAEAAPKILSIQIPLDKVGEVIGPKGKVINAIQQETGATVEVDDDGTVGTVTIGAKDASVLEDARSRIALILDPPTAEIGAVYVGKVVNITKFGAFVNILPGRDGLLHISKLAPRGRRVEVVDDVLSLGQEVSVKVDDVDPQGKVSLSLAASDGDDAGNGDDTPAGGSAVRGPRGSVREGAASPASAEGASTKRVVSIEDALDAELESEFGYLGPRDALGSASGDSASRSRSDAGGRGGNDRRRRPGRGRR